MTVNWEPLSDCCSNKRRNQKDVTLGSGNCNQHFSVSIDRYIMEIICRFTDNEKLQPWTEKMVLCYISSLTGCKNGCNNRSKKQLDTSRIVPLSKLHPWSLLQKPYHSKPHSLRTLTVCLMTLCWDYHIKLEWIIILTPHDLQPTFEHVGSCMTPACRDTTSSALLLSQVDQQDHLNPECYDAVILLTGESTLTGLFLVFGLVWTLLFVWEHVVLFSSAFFSDRCCSRTGRP